MLPLETEWKIRLRKLLRLNNHQCLSHRMQMPNGNHHRTPTFFGSGSMKRVPFSQMQMLFQLTMRMKDSLKEMNKPSTSVSLQCLVCLIKTLMHSLILEDNQTDAGIQQPNNQQHLSLAQRMNSQNFSFEHGESSHMSLECREDNALNVQ